MTTGRINQVAAETRTAACVQPAPRATVRSPQDAATACNRVCVDPSNLVLGFDVRVCLSVRLLSAERCTDAHRPVRDRALASRPPSPSRVFLFAFRVPLVRVRNIQDI